MSGEESRQISLFAWSELNSLLTFMLKTVLFRDTLCFALNPESGIKTG